MNRLNKTKDVKNMEDADLEAERTAHMKELAQAKRVVVEAEVRGYICTECMTRIHA